MISLRAMPVRFRILAVLIALSLINYLLRTNISVAMPSIREEFGIHERRDWLDPRQLHPELHAVPDSGRHLRRDHRPPPGARHHRDHLGCADVSDGLCAVSDGGISDRRDGLADRRAIPDGHRECADLPDHGRHHRALVPDRKLGIPQFAVFESASPSARPRLGPVVTLLIIYFGWRNSFYALAPLGFLVGAWWYWYGARPARATPRDHVRGSRTDQSGPRSGGDRYPATRQLA